MARPCTFTEKQLEWLVQNYETSDWDTIFVNIPNKTKTQISSKASDLGVKRAGVEYSVYSEAEDDMIRKYYRLLSIEELIRQYLPNRTASSIVSRASIIGVSKQGGWTEEEDRIIKENYYVLPMKELSKLLPNRAASAVHCRIKQLGLRGAAMYKYSEDDIAFVRENYRDMSDEELGRCLHRAAKSIKEMRRKNGIYRKDKNAGTHYISVLRFIQANNAQWKKKSMERCGYKNIIDGKGFNDIHHLFAKNLILDQALKNIGMEMPEDINILSDEDKQKILTAFLEEQDKHPLGVCIGRKQHKLFHAKYGFGGNTPEQFIDFIKTYYPEKLDEIKIII